MRYKTLLTKGAVEKCPLTFHQDRAKFSGYMYGGSATLKLGENEFIFDLWHHGGDEMTLEQVKEHISLKGIKTPTKYYDLHWYAIMTEDEIWLHPEGWFNNKVLRKEPIIERRDNYNFQRDTLTDKDREHLLGLGFFRLI